jgi:hypothetical protein
MSTADSDVNAVYAQRTTGALVYCVACIDGGEIQTVHIFSSADKRKAWVDSLPDTAYMTFVHYDYVIDDPDRMEKPPRRAQ